MLETYREYFATSALFGLEERLNQTYDIPTAERLLLEMGKKKDEILADYNNLRNEAMQVHLQKSIAPGIAAYLVLCQNGMPKQEAKKLMDELFFAAGARKRDMFRAMTQREDFYDFFFSYGKQSLVSEYPQEYWGTEMVCDTDREVAFNIHKCIYWDAAQKYGCPELGESFCKNDYTVMEGVYPKVRFERSQTLGTGGNCCDFRLVANRSEQA